MMPQWISDLISVWPLLGAIATTIFILTFLWNKWGPGIRTALRVLDRLTGVPADPRTGQTEVLGLFEWLTKLNAGQDSMRQTLTEQNTTLTEQNTTLTEQNATLETIRHEVEFNNGSSVKDATLRLEDELGRISEKLDRHLAACPPQTNVTVMTTGAQST